MNSQNRTNATLPTLIPSSEMHVQTCTVEKVIGVLQNIGYLMSFVCLIRVYYYFRTKGVYTLQKKNLLSLCVNLWTLYSLIIVDMFFFKIPNFLVVISCCELTTTVLLFVMSLDTCLNLYRRARGAGAGAGGNLSLPWPLRLPMSTAVDDATCECRLFLLYTFCSWILSQGVAYTLAYFYDDFLIILVELHLLAYTAILLMFFVSLYHLKPANVNLGAGHRNMVIFRRTLIIAFVMSSIKFLFAVYFYATGKKIDSTLYVDCIMAWDGVFIYYCLTFNNRKAPAAGSGFGSRLHGTSQVQVHAITNNHAMQNANNDNRNHHRRHRNNNSNDDDDDDDGGGIHFPSHLQNGHVAAPTSAPTPLQIPC